MKIKKVVLFTIIIPASLLISYHIVCYYINQYVLKQYQNAGHFQYHPSQSFTKEDILKKVSVYNTLFKKKTFHFFLSKTSKDMIDNLYDFVLVGSAYFNMTSVETLSEKDQTLHWCLNHMDQFLVVDPAEKMQRIEECLDFLSVQFMVTHNKTCLFLFKKFIQSKDDHVVQRGYYIYHMFGLEHQNHMIQKIEESGHNIYDPETTYTKDIVLKKIKTYHDILNLPFHTFFSSNDTNHIMRDLFFQIINGIDFLDHDSFDWGNELMQPFAKYRQMIQKMNQEIKQLLTLKKEHFSEDDETMKKVIHILTFVHIKYIVSHDPECLEIFKQLKTFKSEEIVYIANLYGSP